MSRKNFVGNRSNGVNAKANAEPSVDTNNDEPESAQTSRVPQDPQRGRQVTRGGEGVLGYAQMAARNPLTTLVASFSVGFGLGILATAILSPREPKGWLERHHLPDSLEEVSSGIRRIPSMIAHQLPDSLTRR